MSEMMASMLCILMWSECLEFDSLHTSISFGFDMTSSLSSLEFTQLPTYLKIGSSSQAVHCPNVTDHLS